MLGVPRRADTAYSIHERKGHVGYKGVEIVLHGIIVCLFHLCVMYLLLIGPETENYSITSVPREECKLRGVTQQWIGLVSEREKYEWETELKDRSEV